MRSGPEKSARATDEIVALDIDEAEAIVARDALRELGVSCVGAEGSERAALVVVQAKNDAVARIAEIRARGRIDVGVIVVRSAEIDPRPLHRAGALASVTTPVDPVALATIVEHAVAPDRDELHDSIGVHASSAMLARLGGALAHEIGTPLAALSMNLDVVARELDRLRASEDLLRALCDGAATMHDVRAHLDALEPEDPIAMHDARASIDRLGDLLQRIKAIADRTQKPVVSFALGSVVRDAARLAAGGDVVLEERVAPNVSALGHAQTVETIVTALVRNASEAARELTSPRVRVETEATDDEAMVRVVDNGPGVDVEVQRKIFEPFYTTRRGLGGVGLGLTVARDQARALGGDVTLESTPGRGASFVLRLRRGET